MNEQVTEYISNLKQDWQAEICTRIRQMALQIVPDVTERLQYGKPHYLKGKQYACVLGTAKEYVSFTIFNAKSLQAPDGFFEAGDPDRKTVKIRKGQEIDYNLLERLLKQASQ